MLEGRSNSLNKFSGCIVIRALRQLQQATRRKKKYFLSEENHRAIRKSFRCERKTTSFTWTFVNLIATLGSKGL